MQTRIIISVMLSIGIILASLGVISYLSVNDSLQRSLESRLTLAKIIGKYIDHMLESNLIRLHDIAVSGQVDFEDDDWTLEKRAIKTAYDYSIFTDRIFLMDMHGNVLLTHPHHDEDRVNLLSIPYVSKAISERRPLVSDVYTLAPTQRKVIFALVPISNENGEVIGVAGGEINPTNYLFTQILKSIPANEGTIIEIVDSHGIIISSNQEQRMLTLCDHNKFLGNLITEKENSVGVCHRCHLAGSEPAEKTQDMLALASLSIPSWGIAIREPQQVVFAPSTLLKRGFFSLSIIAIGTSILLAVGLSRSIVRPLRLLSQAAHRIGQGNLSSAIEISGSDEIGSLARSFDTMRVRLSESLQRIRKQNVELEYRVVERTKDLAASRAQLSNVLMKVITAGEEERKRVARELHDDTSQSLNAILMSMDALSLTLKEKSEAQKTLDRLRQHCVITLAGLHRMIKDLRPPILDDLGLESAIRWVLERHLGDKGIDFSLEVNGSCKEVRARRKGAMDCAKLELQLFRVIQESIINIEKHAEASNVSVSLTYQNSHVEIAIEDDGRGFDVEKVCDLVDREKDIGCMGLLGLRERISLLGGKVTLCSRVGHGTQISAFVPL